MKRVLPLLIVLCILSGCSFPGVESALTAEPPAPDLPERPAPQSAADKRCGDGACDGPETAA
ncbi:MAG: hypothetical protein P8Z41_15690, partial [Anaerolineales bacterium]